MRIPTAFFFDFDGVLVESVAIKAWAFGQLYSKQGPEFVSRVQAHHEANGGMSRYEKFRLYSGVWQGVTVDAGLSARLDLEYSDLVEAAVSSCAWVDGAREIVAAAKEHGPVFLVSATPQAELIRIVEKRGIRDDFSAIRGSPTSKADHVAALLSEWSVRPETAVFIGDAMADLEAAMGAGIPFLGRVPIGRASPFPQGTPYVRDMRQALHEVGLVQGGEPG